MLRQGELDVLARCYLDEGDPAQAERLLAELVFEQAQPLVEKIVSGKLGHFAGCGQDVQDVCGEAMVGLLAKLEEWKSSGGAPASNLSGYIAVTAYNACDEYFRHKFPQRHRLKNRLRYLLKPGRGFDLWHSESGEWVCGWAGWRNQGVPVQRGAWLEHSFAGLPSEPVEFLAAVFDAVGGPVEFNELVTLVARAWGIKDQQISLDAAMRPVSPVDARVEDREAWKRCVRQVWEEIRTLPVGQKVALLLNLRGSGGMCAIGLFPLTGVASGEEIAEELGIPALEFAELWNRLPLGDAEIAARLGVTRQQVINLRLSARRRLERRMGDAIIEGNQRL